MSNAVFVGNHENIYAYSLVGFKTVEVKNKNEAENAIHQLLGEDISFIFVDGKLFDSSAITLNSKNIHVIPIPFAHKNASNSIVSDKSDSNCY